MTQEQSPENQLPMCSCGKERVRAANQRYGAECHKQASKRSRQKNKKRLEELARQVEQLKNSAASA